MAKQKTEQAFRAQVAALPVRKSAAGTEVLLITSRETRRWIIPKGWPMKGRKDAQAAAQEALEEAGVRGKVHKRPIGAYTYQKRLTGSVEACRVMVYVLEVDKLLASWKEKDQRRREWFSPASAADKVSEPQLATIILSIAKPRLGLIKTASDGDLAAS